jgi:uncharacterized protein YwqG
MKPTIRITTQKNINLSKSFFGGLPKVPNDFDWPVWDATPSFLDDMKHEEESYRQYQTDFWKWEIEKSRKRLVDPLIPLVFLGQIHLEEVPRYGQFPNLPPTGILYFFWDAIHYPPGWRASSKGSGRVLYVEETPTLQTQTPPEKMIKKYGEDLDGLIDDSRCSLLFEPRWSLLEYLDTVLTMDFIADEDFYDEEDAEPPTIESLIQESLEEIPVGFSQKSESTILIKNHSIYGEPMHMLFGSPMEVQNPMEEMCQLCFHGFDSTKYNVNRHSKVAHLKEGVKDWQLLLQLDCDRNLNWEWGDCGMLYFWIRSQDLARRDFSNVWCEMQCS